MEDGWLLRLVILGFYWDMFCIFKNSFILTYKLTLKDFFCFYLILDFWLAIFLFCLAVIYLWNLISLKLLDPIIFIFTVFNFKNWTEILIILQFEIIDLFFFDYLILYLNWKSNLKMKNNLNFTNLGLTFELLIYF